MTEREEIDMLRRTIADLSERLARLEASRFVQPLPLPPVYIPPQPSPYLPPQIPWWNPMNPYTPTCQQSNTFAGISTTVDPTLRLMN
jgi:hypothetical protein